MLNWRKAKKVKQVCLRQCRHLSGQDWFLTDWLTDPKGKQSPTWSYFLQRQVRTKNEIENLTKLVFNLEVKYDFIAYCITRQIYSTHYMMNICKWHLIVMVCIQIGFMGVSVTQTINISLVWMGTKIDLSWTNLHNLWIKKVWFSKSWNPHEILQLINNLFSCTL